MVISRISTTMDPAFAAYGYGLMAGLGGVGNVGGSEGVSSLANVESGIASESTPSHLFEGHQQHHHNTQGATQHIHQGIGQQQPQQSSNQENIGAIHHHISTGIHQNHSHELGGHEQSEHNNGNNNTNGGTSTSVQIPQGTYNSDYLNFADICFILA